MAVTEAPCSERRQHRRHLLSAGVQFHHGPSDRKFPGRCVDISEGGMLLYVPAATPVQSGQPIRLCMSADPARPEEPMQATVVRVDRKRLVTTGYLAVGIQFGQAV